MDDSNGLAEGKHGGEKYEQNIETEGIPASLDADVDLLQSISVPLLQSRSPCVEKGDRNPYPQDLSLGARGPRCSHDLHTGPTIEYKSGLDTFVFPTPSPRLPTPSPRHSHRLSPGSTTPQQLPSDRRRESPRIGMAIGSPSHAPPSWGRSQTAECMPMRIQQRPPLDILPAITKKQAKSKTLEKERRVKNMTSWRLFSKFFKRSTKLPVPVANNPVSKGATYEENLGSPLERPISSSYVRFDDAAATLPLSATLPDVRPGSSRKYHARTLSEPRAQPRCGSRNSVRTSFTRLIRSPCARTTPSSSPWRGNFSRGEQVQSGTQMMYSCSATISRTPRLELDLPEPEMERYSVMFSHLLAPVASNESKPSLLERRLSRMPAVHQDSPITNTVEPRLESWSKRQHSQKSMQLRGSLPVNFHTMRSTSATPAMATHRPRQIMRSQTAPMYETGQRLATSPESDTGSASRSETSLPATPTTPNNCIDTAVVSTKQEREPAWNILTSQPVILCPSDVMNSRVDHSIDIEQQIVQVSVARQVSINQARSRVRRTVSMRRPNMVNFAAAKNRKSEVGILDSVDVVEEEMPGT